VTHKARRGQSGSIRSVDPRGADESRFHIGFGGTASEIDGSSPDCMQRSDARPDGTQGDRRLGSGGRFRKGIGTSLHRRPDNARDKIRHVLGRVNVADIAGVGTSCRVGDGDEEWGGGGGVYVSTSLISHPSSFTSHLACPFRPFHDYRPPSTGCSDHTHPTQLHQHPI
jgi:hypothetical protein